MASIPFEYACSKEGGFVMDPNEHKRIGYITALAGLGMSQPFPSDLQVSLPLNANTTYTAIKTTVAPGMSNVGEAKVVGVIEKFSWNGGVGDPIHVDFYVSQENAHQIKALQQQALKTTHISAFGWWIADYDQEIKVWFEQSFPQSGPTITGIITGKENPALNVDLTPVVAKDGIDVNVYKISLGLVPAANTQYALHFANSSKMNVVKSWGLVVGTLGSQALPGD
ncbi:MAG TPA: hypothetical protein VGD98_22695 [Ktedonobacteraceae bacterium]